MIVRSRAALLAGVAGVAALLAGCSAGQNTQTAAKEPSVPGVHTSVGEISLRNVQIAYGGRDHRSYPEGGNAPLEVRIFNGGTQTYTLSTVSSDAAESVVLVDNPDNEASEVCPAASVNAPAGSPSPTGSPSPGESPSPTASPASPSPEASPSPDAAGSEEFGIVLTPGSCALLDTGRPYHLELAGLRREIAPGDTVTISFTFTAEDGESLEATLRVPVGPPTDGPEHSPLDIHPPEPPAVGGHEPGEEDGGH